MRKATSQHRLARLPARGHPHCSIHIHTLSIIISPIHRRLAYPTRRPVICPITHFFRSCQNCPPSPPPPSTSSSAILIPIPRPQSTLLTFLKLRTLRPRAGDRVHRSFHARFISFFPHICYSTLARLNSYIISQFCRRRVSTAIPRYIYPDTRRRDDTTTFPHR